jgi:tetratricopeptide (TPR) repeat protein
MYGLQKQYFHAMKQYQKVLEIKEDSPDAHVGLAGVYRMTGRNTQALQEFEKVLQLQPKSQVALFNAADLSVQLRKYEEAAAYATDLVTDNPQNINARYILAQTYAAQWNTINATMELEDILRTQSVFQPAILDLGLMYLGDREPEQAKEQFDALLKLNEKQTAAMIGAAVAAQELGLDVEAITYCEKVLETQPDNQLVQFVLGNIYWTK